jgi:biopolymer transport protein ExbD
MARRRISSGGDEALADMTPMLDVVFIMLIFFIVTTSFIKEAGIEVNRPTASTATSKENATILIAISETGEVWMDNRRVDVRSVRANVERMKAESAEGAVVIQADKSSQTGTLVSVMDQVRSAGITNISIAGTPGSN